MNKSDWKNELKGSKTSAVLKEDAEKYEIRDPVFEYAIKELEWHAQHSDPATGIESTGVDMVWVCTR
jgi:hypothetical protein